MLENLHFKQSMRLFFKAGGQLPALPQVHACSACMTLRIAVIVLTTVWSSSPFWELLEYCTGLGLCAFPRSC